MTFKNYLAGFLSLFISAVYAQPRLQLSPSSVTFQPLFESQLDSVSVTITNNGLNPLTVSISIPFEVYKSTPYYIKDTSFTLASSQFKIIQVYAKLSHNVLNTASLLVKGKEESGADAVNNSIAISCQGKYSNTYYNTSQNLAEEALKQALKTKLGLNSTSLGYDNARDNMYGTIDNFNDTVTCIYTNRKAKFNTRNGAGSNNFNCEHTFPQGFFSSNEPMRSDMHHLYSTDEKANNSRSNLPFGVAKAPFLQPTWNAPSLNGGGKYEPQDSHKGRCARSMMYFVLRYQDYTNFYAPQDSILRAWSKQFPPNTWDINRTNAIFLKQNNRNPFVDYPQFADRLTSLISNSVSDSSTQIKLSNESFDISMADANDTKKFSLLVWNTGNKTLKISGLKIKGNQASLDNPADSVFFIPKNGSKTIWFGKTNCSEVADTISFLSSDISRPKVHVPLVCLATENQKSIAQRFEPQISPNPTNRDLVLSNVGNDSPIHLTIIDLLGKTVYHQTISLSSDYQISLPELANGLYQIRLQQTDRIHVQKLLIQK